MNVAETRRFFLPIVLAALACRQESVGPGPNDDDLGAAAVALGDSVTGIFAPPIAIEGKIVDERTGSGIAGATVIVLRPGVGPDRWESSPADSTASLMAGAALSDSAGHWWIDDLVRGRDYTVMIAARGYRPAVFEDGLSLLQGDSSPTRIAPVLLKSR
ncbi:MAG TPA: carboxypeptidase-like regulatory domain-containing protein [Gemmatimonadota bacterium]|nr:carboxypeptidase-like regulatory domain-containing protein [Gemmatimonadota bacterium]